MELHGYTHLEVKAVSGATRTISGIASTPRPDRQGHVLEPLGARFTNPIPLLLHHDTRQPVGQATLTATKAGLLFEASIASVTDAGPLRDRLDDTWQQLQAGLLNKVSIGFQILEKGAERLANGLLRLVNTEICELSLTTLPVNADAVVLNVKSLDAACYVPVIPPAAPQRAKAMTTAEQITECETRRATCVARITAILDGGDRMDEARQKECDSLQAEVTDLDARLPRLKAFEQTLAGAATPIAATPATRTAVPPRIHVKPNVPPGMAFVRYCKAMTASQGDSMKAIAYAQQWWADSTPEVELILRAAVNPATTTYTPWAGALVPSPTHLAAEFVDLLRPATLVGRIPGLRRVPFNSKVPRQTGGGTYSWVAQGAPKPVTSLAFDSVILGQYKIAAILVFTMELARNSSPDAETTFRDSMIAGITRFKDSQFIDPAVALVAGVNPASITNGVTGIPATTNPLADITNLLNSFIAANIPLAGVVLIMSESNAFILSSQRTLNGEQIFPSVTVGGGSINGIPVITSSVAGTNIIALVPQYVLYAEDPTVSVDVSREASVQMVDNPAAPDATAVFVSLWQQNEIGLRAEQMCAWLKAHTNAVNMITGTAYTP
jgi:HK97 family phage major capsid protein/HK97 family phage prohead protease